MKTEGQSEPETALTVARSPARIRMDGQNRGSSWLSVKKTAVVQPAESGV
jgi:hypothetical protein